MVTVDEEQATTILEFGHGTITLNVVGVTQLEPGVSSI